MGYTYRKTFTMQEVRLQVEFVVTLINNLQLKTIWCSCKYYLRLWYMRHSWLPYAGFYSDFLETIGIYLGIVTLSIFNVIVTNLAVKLTVDWHICSKDRQRPVSNLFLFFIFSQAKRVWDSWEQPQKWGESTYNKEKTPACTGRERPHMWGEDTCTSGKGGLHM